MLNILERFHLGLFGEGEGSGEGDAGGDEAGEAIPSSVPARARENYKKALNQSRSHEPAAEETPEDTNEPEAPTHVPYADIIKSDEYKEEHKAYMDKTISDRLKKYKGIEERAGRQSELLSLVAQKYGLDSRSETFLDDLKGRIEADDSYYEQYALDHDVSTTEARKIVSLERQVAEQKEREEARQQEEMRRQRWQALMQSAEACKQAFPNFDFDTEWANPKFVDLVARLGGDVTTAYKVLHFSELQNRTVQSVSQRVAQQTVNAVKSNRARPIENGLNGSVASQTVAQDFSKMNLNELRAWADAQRRGKRR